MLHTLPTLPAILLVLAAVCGGGARASDLGIAPVAVHLDRLNERAVVTVTNRGAEPVVMQAEAVEWRRDGQLDTDRPTTDMLINPAVFTMQPGQSQLMRVGLRRAPPGEHEATYRIVVREVPQPPRPGEQRPGGQVQVLMAMRVPIYLAPLNVVRALHWQATQAGDGSVTASLRNDGNVHARVGSLQLRSAEGVALAPEQAAGAVVFPGESRSFRVAGTGPAGATALPAMTLDVMTDHGTQQVPVAQSRR